MVNLKKQGPLDGYEIPYFMRKFYDELFGISDKCFIMRESKYEIKQFEESTLPLKMVSKTLTEGFLEDDVYRRRAWEYRTYNIGTLQGMSFKEWMSQTPTQMNSLLSDIQLEKDYMTPPPPPNVSEMTPEEQAEHYRQALLRGSKAV